MLYAHRFEPSLMADGEDRPDLAEALGVERWSGASDRDESSLKDAGGV